MPPPAREAPGGSLSSILLRFLLTAVALLSSYSIHLLLESSGVVGEPPTQPGAREGWAGETTPDGSDSSHPQASVPMSSWATVPLGPQGSWQRPWPSRCRILEVRLAGRHRQAVGRWAVRRLAALADPSACPPLPSAMSSYLYIIKSELPLVIQTFLNLEEQTS